MSIESMNEHEKEANPPGPLDLYLLLRALQIGAIDFKQFL